MPGKHCKCDVGTTLQIHLSSLSLNMNREDLGKTFAKLGIATAKIEIQMREKAMSVVGELGNLTVEDTPAKESCYLPVVVLFIYLQI